MIVTVKSMDKYRKKLRAVNKKCADEVQAYMEAHNFQIDDDFIAYAHSLTTLYGEAAAELSCQLYDEISTYWADVKKGKRVPPAIPADVATYGDVAKTIQGTAKKSLTQIPEGVATLVKRAAEDTTLKNALRDGAEFAWIPNGDTCAFCRMIASNGWRKISAKALKNGHAEHIHPNCDCSYVARPSGSNIDFEGYDPDALYQDYQELGLDGMRRKIYAENKDKILAQQRLAYARRSGNVVENALIQRINKSESISDIVSIMDEQGIKIFGKTKGVELQSMKDTSNSIVRWADELGVPPNELVETIEIGKTFDFSAQAQMTGRNMVLNYDMYSHPEALKAAYDNAVARGYHPLGTTVKNATDHEIGHAAELLLNEKLAGERYSKTADLVRKYQSNHRAAENIVGKVGKKHFGIEEGAFGDPLAMAKYKVGQSISEYAGKSFGEALAEAFADVAGNGANANPISIDIVNEVKKELLNG